MICDKSETSFAILTKLLLSILIPAFFHSNSIPSPLVPILPGTAREKRPGIQIASDKENCRGSPGSDILVGSDDNQFSRLFSLNKIAHVSLPGTI